MNGDIQEMMDAVIMAENAEKNERSRGNLTFINLIYRINNKKSRDHFSTFIFDYLAKANGIS